MKGDDENTDTWIKLAAATANVVRWLQFTEQENEQRERQSSAGHSDEQKGEKNRHNVDCELNEERAVRE
jgi:hypothetical protein